MNEKLAILQGPWRKAAEGSPDPLSVLSSAERMSAAVDPETRERFARDPLSLERLARFLSASPALVPFAARNARHTARLFLDGGLAQCGLSPEEKGAFLAGCAKAGSFDLLSREIARFRNLHLVRLYSQEILDMRPAWEIWAEWSEVASTCIQGALEGCRALLASPPEPLRMAVIGLGKLGGNELNFASDIDLLYLYETGGGEPGAGHQRAALWAAKTTSVLERATEEGPLFRVDLGLRPGGKDGDLVITLDAAERYYQDLASPWERWALLKARPVAGDNRLGTQFVRMARPFVFRRYLDFGSLDDIREIKERIRREARRRGSRLADVKMGRGGIREIEFLVQTLQIIFGGKRPELQETGTLKGLEALAAEGLLAEREAGAFRGAYLFLRRLEHRLQMVHHRQQSRLPGNERELRRIASLMGYSHEEGVQDFLEEVEAQLGIVREAFEELLGERRGGQPVRVDKEVEGILSSLGDGRVAAAHLRKAGFRDPETVRQSIERILGDRFPARRSPKAAQILLRLLPSILSLVRESADPDQALYRTERFLEAVGPRGGYYALLQENPEILERLVRIFSRSALLSRWLETHIETVDGLIDHGQHPPRRTRDELYLEVDDRLRRLGDPEERLAGLREFRMQEILRIGAADLWELLNPFEVGQQLADLAEVFLEITFREVLGAAGLYPGGGAPPLAIVGLGSFGGRELSYRSDLDLLFLFQEDSSWRPPERYSRAEYLTRMGQRLLSWMTIPMREGPGWQVDARLRPSGNLGPLMVGLDAFERYHAEQARPWERQSLLKARLCGGDPETGERAMARISALLSRAAPVEPDELHRMRIRMERERGGDLPRGAVHLKMGPGGIADLEFLVQYHQLKRWARDPGLHHTHTAELIQRLVGASLLSEEHGRFLLKAYLLFKGVENRLGLVLDHKGTDRPCTPEDLMALEPLEGAPWMPSSPSGENLAGVLSRAMTRVRSIYLEHLGQPTK